MLTASTASGDGQITATTPDGTTGTTSPGSTPSPGGSTAPPSPGGVAPIYVCECDFTTVCDPACACDPECDNQSGCLSSAAPLGSSSTGNLWSLIALMGGFLLLRRRRGLNRLQAQLWPLKAVVNAGKGERT